MFQSSERDLRDPTFHRYFVRVANTRHSRVIDFVLKQYGDEDYIGLGGIKINDTESS